MDTMKAAEAAGGGSGGYAESKFYKNKGDVITFSVGGNVSCEGITVTAGGNGNNAREGAGYVYGGTGGSAGTASGGNLLNVQGKKGNDGSKDADENTNRVSCNGGSGGNTGYGVAGGKGADVKSWSCGSPSNGNGAWIKIYRGNTNIK